MIRADEEPTASATYDPNANGSGVAGYWNTGIIGTVFGPDAANHLQEEIALTIEGEGVTLDFADKGQLAAIFDSTTGVYGDGSDGTATISIATSLTADGHYEDLTINDGIELNLAGYRLFVRGTLTMGDGSIISNNGSDGADFAGTPPAFPPGGAGALGRTVGGGGAGGDGGDTAGSVSAGSNPTPGGGEGFSGNGGAGGNGSPGVGQELGAVAGIHVPITGQRPTLVPTMQTGIVHYQTGGTLYTFMLAGGSGGGGGGGGSAATTINGYGGAGGGGGGVAIVCARTLVNPVAPAGAAYIEATGGDGGTDLTVGVANGGGGGGGGGGTVLLTTRTRIGDPGLLILDASGGASGGALTAGNGVNGTAGNTFELMA